MSEPDEITTTIDPLREAVELARDGFAVVWIDQHARAARQEALRVIDIDDDALLQLAHGREQARFESDGTIAFRSQAAKSLRAATADAVFIAAHEITAATLTDIVRVVASSRLPERVRVRIRARL